MKTTANNLSTINIMGFACPKIKKTARLVAQQALNLLGQAPVELTIKFVSPKQIRRLNANFRQTDRVTDVLSFPSFDVKVGELVPTAADNPSYLGDMAICLKQTKRQAKEYGNTNCQEVKKLVIHSVLHMLGYDHIKDEDYLVMNSKEIDLDKQIQL